jgi:hypothetical protein
MLYVKYYRNSRNQCELYGCPVVGGGEDSAFGKPNEAGTRISRTLSTGLIYTQSVL